jgi:hypothetical protein
MERTPMSVLSQVSIRIPPISQRESLFVMWMAAGYFDESDDNDRAYAVAGFLGHQHDIVHLEWTWRDKILDKYGLDYFKASELEYGVGQFSKFRDNPKDSNALFSEREKNLFRQIKTDSIDVIVSFDTLVGFGAVMMLPDYDRLLQEHKAIGKTLLAPYFFCSQVVLAEAGFIMKDISFGKPGQQQGRVKPVFDSHEQYSGRAKQSFDEWCRKNPETASFLLPPDYEDDREWIVLQVADNLAYESRRLLITEEYDRHLPERKAMTRLKERIYRIYKLDYASMKLVLDSQEPDVLPIKPAIANALHLK